MPETGASKRRVGVEIEFSGLTVEETVAVITRLLGGRPEAENRFRAHVRDSEIGDILVELDTRYAKAAEDPGLIDAVIDAVATREGAAQLLSDVMPVPLEIVTAPLTETELVDLDRLIGGLRQEGAVGTKGGTLYAYGLHLNVEHTGDTREMILIAAAYTFAERWLRQHRMGPDNARRFTPFIDPMPTGFIIALAQAMEDGPMGFEDFVALYGRYNPRRNRGLDLWPLLGHLDRDLAQRHHSGPLPSTRPAFHFRLPDSRIDQPGWSPRDALADWDLVTGAAHEPERLEEIRRRALDYNRGRIARGAYLSALDRVFE